MDAGARTLRPMDLIAEDAGAAYLVVLPQPRRSHGAAAIERLLDFARATNTPASSATALCPDDGTSVDTLIGRLRGALRTGRPAPAEQPTANEPLIVDATMQRVYSLVERIAD